MLDMQQQISGGFRISQGTVRAPRGWQAKRLYERAEFVIGCVRVETPGQQHGASELLLPAFMNQTQFSIPEFPVKSSVMRDKGMSTSKVCRFTHDDLNAGSIAYHLTGDAGQRLNFVGNRYAWVHQALVTVDYSVITDQNNGYFGRASTVPR